MSDELDAELVEQNPFSSEDDEYGDITNAEVT